MAGSGNAKDSAAPALRWAAEFSQRENYHHHNPRKSQKRTMSTRIGKIGRLSKERRNELGQRIEDGLPGMEIVQWLNAQPDVQKILQAQFAGRPISEQN